jgi:hypothetical protein
LVVKKGSNRRACTCWVIPVPVSLSQLAPAEQTGPVLIQQSTGI